MKPVPIPKQATGADGAAVQILLQNSQTRFGTDADQFYNESAAKILSAQGLAGAGNFMVAWQPDTETLTIHRFEIIRGDQTIDVLAGGKKVTVLRRETNLELAMLDGSLTATLQPEGLQVGDIVHVAYTLQRRDPVFQGRSEGFGALSRPGVVGRAYVRVTWPKSKTIRWRATEGFGAPTPNQTSDGDELLFDLTNAEAPKPPRDAPPRFDNLAQVEFSQFASWSEVSALMAPLYLKASTLTPASPLRAEVDRIRAASNDPKARAMAALRLVEDQTRYVFLGMNDGGYVPADADATWSRRFGDCKGKTALLLALLRALDIDAEPALVSTTFGDGLDQRLPLLEVFDHVMVRAQIAGKVYWLDGTRMGDRTLDDLPVPNFHWALPLKAEAGGLEPLLPPAYADPHFESRVKLDATGGLDVPATAHAEHIYRGDEGLDMHLALQAISHADADHYLRDYWRKSIPWIAPKQVGVDYNDATGVVTLSMDGAATIDWAKSGDARDFDVGDSGLGQNVNYEREPGPHQDAPYAVGYPMYKTWTVTILLPNKGDGFALVNAGAVDKTVAGIEFQRHSRIENGTATIVASERSVAPEFPASEATAASAALRQLADYNVIVRSLTSAEAALSGGQGADLDTERARLVTASTKAQNGDVNGALADLKVATTAPAFARLTPSLREQSLVLMSAAAAQAGDFGLAHTAAEQAIAIGGAGQNEWVMRLAAAARLRDYDDEAVSLAKIAQSWPAYLSTLNDSGVFDLAIHARGDRQFGLLAALHDAHWRPKSEFRDAGSLWLRLATELIDRDDLKAAKAVAQDIDDYGSMIEMHADKRFDPIVQSDPARYDVRKAVERRLADLRVASAAAPNKLEGVNYVADALRTANRPAEALALIDEALAKAPIDVNGTSYFSDVDDQISISLELRGMALQMLGRPDEAVKARMRAAAHSEHGGVNVSQTLNLGELYDSLGRPRDALDEIQDFDPRHASPFGVMVWENVRACAYAQLKDQPNLDATVKYLRDHAKDGTRPFEGALLCAGDDDGVARSMIGSLVDPETRASTLRGLQNYEEDRGAPPWEKDMDLRRLAIRARPDVQAAIAKVGRIESYPIIQ